MAIIKHFDGILHGGDYNPEQWLDVPGIIDQDFQYMEEASCNAFSVGIFSWSQLEPEEGRFDFSWLDDIFDRAERQNIKLLLATPSAAKPAWLADAYPDSCRMPESGKRYPWFARQNNCLNSPGFRERVRIIDRALAERYADHPALGGWHVSNEYWGMCNCPICRQKFSDYLRRRYGTIEELNRAYWSGFWGHKMTSWNQIYPLDDAMDGARLDWRRFSTESIVDFFRWEIAAIREFSDAPVTTNMMGTFNGVDYWKFAPYCDFISDDCYPVWYEGGVEEEAASFAMKHDMHYSMRNKPFVMLESCPGIPNYRPYVKLRRPGEFQREMMLALGHGADGTMYFQWRKGLGNCEKLHGAVIGHDGTNQTMVFKQVKDYGEHLKRVAEISGARKHPDAAVMFDWEVWWALETSNGFGGKEREAYEKTVTSHYRALWKKNVDLAVIDSDQEFSNYKLLVAPMLYMLKKGVAERLKAFVRQGGTLVMTYLSAYVDDCNRCCLGGYPGQGLRELFGIWNEDIDGLEPATEQSILWRGKEYKVQDYAEYLHAEGAEVWGTCGKQFYQGTPALTCRTFGSGRAIYLGVRTGLDFLADFYDEVLSMAGVKSLLEAVPEGLVVSRRGQYLFVLNLTQEERCLSLPRTMTDLWNGEENIRQLILPPNGSGLLKDRQTL